MLFFMVKLKVCKLARAIFLVKGHTKNDDCDRMFNLMKYDYRKVDCFTPSELVELANKHPQVDAVAMDTKDFKDWDELENKMIDLMDGVKKNHIFTVKARDSNAMMIQEYAGAPVTRKVLVNKAFRDADWNQLFRLQELTPPGLPDIKWNELYLKWGRFVPEHRKSGLKYYVEQPPAALKKAIAEQSAQAKAARAKRTRGGTEQVSEATKKKRGCPKKQN